MISLKARRYVLIVGVAVTGLSVLVGVSATLLTRREGGPTILAPLLLLPTFVLSLLQVRRVEQGRQVEEPAMARLRGWLIPLFTVVVVIALVALDVAWLRARL